VEEEIKDFKKSQSHQQQVMSSSRSAIRIFVFLGGDHDAGQMHPPFKSALTETLCRYRKNDIDVSYEEWSIRKLRASTDWTEEDFARFIFDNFDIHIFLSHPHQGSNGLGWNAEWLYECLRRFLFFRPGYPCQDGWFCPIFTQNKMVYLSALPEIVNSSKAIIYTDWQRYTLSHKEKLFERCVLLYYHDSHKVLLFVTCTLSACFYCETINKTFLIMKSYFIC
jgi:hypothetical protein